MNRREFMDFAALEFMTSKRGYGEEQTAVKHAAKLGAKLSELGYIGESAPENADFIVHAAIRFMAADGGHYGDENMAINKAVALFNMIENPKAALAKLTTTVAGPGVDNPNNLPVYGPGGQLQVSGIPTMPSWPAGSTQPTSGVMTDSAISHTSNAPAQPVG